MTCKDKNKCKNSCSKTCDSIIYIHAISFKDIVTRQISKTYIIDKPGNYLLCESINFIPIVSGQSAIQILSDNVVLDLGSNLLHQVGEMSIPDAIGIRIGLDFDPEMEPQVFKNVTIKNGTIKFSGQGIAVLNSSPQPEEGPMMVFDNLTFSNLNCSECGSDSNPNFASGINLDSFASLEQGSPVAYKNVTIEHCKVNNCLGTGAISVYTCDGLIIKDTQANNTSTSNSFYSQVIAVAIFGNNLQLTNVWVNGTHGVGSNIMDRVHGIWSLFSTNISLVGCHANDTLSDGPTSVTSGLEMESCNNITINNCQFNGTVAQISTFHVGNRMQFCDNISVQDSQFNDTRNETGSNQTFGLLPYYGNDHYFLNCQFNNIFGEVSGTIQGVNCSTCINTVYENCQFNNSRGGAGAGIVAGIHMSDLRNDTIQGNGMKWINCQFNGARTQNPAGLLYGFFAITLKNIIFEDCQATNIISENSDTRSTGFFIGTFLEDPAPGIGDVQNVTFKNCIASDIKGGSDTVGIYTWVNNRNLISGIQALQTNFVIQNCIVERIHSLSLTRRVAGIAEALFVRSGTAQYPRMVNLSVTNCRVSDVKAGKGNPFSSGILVESVENPVLSSNSVSDCDRGILFTGTDQIIPNGFQLATSLANAIAFPPVMINLTTIPSASPLQKFFNLTRSNNIQISPSTTTVDIIGDFIKPTAPIPTNWQTGDEIKYDSNGGNNILNLVNGTTYYVIVYRPGFTRRGLVQENQVTNCSVSGYQDNLVPTGSAWINNVALLNSTPSTAETNYTITWASGIPQVDEGTLAAYPSDPNKYWNLSIVP